MYINTHTLWFPDIKYQDRLYILTENIIENKMI